LLARVLISRDTRDKTRFMSLDKTTFERLVAGIVTGIVLVAGICWLAHTRVQPAPPRLPPIPVVTANTNTPAPPVAVQPAPAPPPAKSDLEKALDRLRDAIDAASARQALAALRQLLEAMPAPKAVAAIRGILDSKQDAATHLGFKLSSNGSLTDAPTLRTFLLDELARIDSSAAAAYSKTILASMDSPDEWAVALRNLANGDSSDEGKALLQEKMQAMLGYAAWQQNPSVGYLEAFDVAVYEGGTNLLPSLTSLVTNQDNTAIAHAAYLALDRLVIDFPATTLDALENAPDAMQGRELTRADYFARADVRDPQQLAILENYLLNPALSPAELNAFAGVYPNANYMISPNLLTQNPTPDHASLMGWDAAALTVAQQWQTDPRFAGIQPAVARIVSRLQLFAQQAAGQ
jgi:hypothetical protein